MVPPSIHPNGEPLEMRIDEPMSVQAAAVVERRVVLYACGCLLLFVLGPRGFHHDQRLALAGFLLQSEVSEGEAILVTEALAIATGNDPRDAAKSIRDTARRLDERERVAGSRKLADLLGDDGAKVVAQLREWLGVEDFVRTEKGAIDHRKPANVRLALAKLDAEPYFDEFALEPRLCWRGQDRTIDDALTDALWLAIERRFGFQPSDQLFVKVVMNAARENGVHPVREYLASLKWDQVERLNRWLVTYGKAPDTPYVRAVGKLVPIAAVRRVRQPGVKFDELLVLEGAQGVLKSSALKALCPNDSWFSDDLPLNVDAKQVIERTSGKWLIEAAELSGMRASQSEHLKATLSRQVDGPVRMAYGRLPTTRPRQFVMIGTTNSRNQYLNDGTGNRRFWPVPVDTFDLAGLLRDRDQLWAEAGAREAAQESIRLDPSLWDAAGQEQEQRRADDPWQEQIAELILGGEPDKRLADRPAYVLVSDLWTHLGVPPERQDKGRAGRVAGVMQTLGFGTKKRLPRKVDVARPMAFWRDGVDEDDLLPLPRLFDKEGQ